MGDVATIHVNGSDRALLSIPEACQVLNIGRSRLYTMMAGPAPALRSVRVGRSVRIPAAAVREYLQIVEQGPEAA